MLYLQHQMHNSWGNRINGHHGMTNTQILTKIDPKCRNHVKILRGHIRSKFGYLPPPPGVPIYRVPLKCYAVDYEDIALRFNLNAFLWLLCFI